ncbi:MAG TPA: OmpA family protein [Burkholderiales bacterium]|nr:OmpA family protein [Burkholderiales bacterium]
MGLANSAVIFSIALVLGACAHTPQWGNNNQTSNELVVLLPKANGSVGAVVVRSGDGADVVLDKPYAAARIEGAGRVQALTYNADRANKEFNAALTALPARPVTYLVYFLEGKDDLTPDSEREVERIFSDIAARPDPEISVVGHTDAVGTMQYNDQLSLQRAQRVREDLTRRGVPDKYIELAGRGKRDPVVRTAAGAPEPMNRRVEIIVR